MEAFFSGEIGLTGTRVAPSQICSTGVHPPGKDRENLNQRGGVLGWSGMIAAMFNPGKACSIAMAAGLTDHQWTMGELLSCPIPLPPWGCSQASAADRPSDFKTLNRSPHQHGSLWCYRHPLLCRLY